jgi:predicted house-cleaning noncanonical NTP pyrophosphatase (MazG superfamily)
VPIYFEGSLLGHAYYILREAGAEVVAVGQSDPTPEVDEYNKLVRDRIPEIIRRGGASARVSRVDAANAVDVLRHKLVEESVEALTADADDLLTELADVAEVIDALLVRMGVGPAALEATRRSRRTARGGFSRMVYLEETAAGAGGNVRAPASDHLPIARGSLVRGSRRRTSSSIEVLEQTGERLVLRMPITPPLEKGLPMTEQRVTIGRGQMTFRHIGRFIEIEVTAPGVSASAGQLSLPIEMDGEKADD